MAQVLHIKNAYFELPDKHKDDIGCTLYVPIEIG